jgi:anti-sigma B factor antagonist
MKFKTSVHGAVTVVHLDGNLMGGPDATALNGKLHELIDGGKNQVVIDLAKVEFMNSSGLGLLIGGASLMKKTGGGLKLAGVSEKILALIKIARLGPVFDTFATVQDAVTSFDK